MRHFDAFFSSEKHGNALIILNQPVCSIEYLSLLWNKCSLRICADGGANRLYEKLSTRASEFIPDHVIGDLDSIEPSVQEFYEANHCSVEFVDDQDSTDFEKCIAKITSLSFDLKQIFVVGATGGRLDQTMSVINTALVFVTSHPTIPMYLLSNENFCTILAPNVKHSIHLKSRNACGLIPIGSTSCRIKTTGLKWNLGWFELIVDESMECGFGKLLSTSNVAVSDLVTIESDQPVLWTMEWSII